MVKTLALTFSGSAVTSSTFAGVMSLRDANNQDVVASDNAASSTVCTSLTTCTETWTFATTTTPFVISGGSSYTFTLQANDTNLTVATGSASVNLGITVQAVGDVTYYDAGDTTGNVISLPATIVPLNVNQVTFSQGT
jgi:hypothetical protein